MNNETKPSKEELLARVKAARHRILRQVMLDSPRLISIWFEFRMCNSPLRFFNTQHEIWIQMANLPLFSHTLDDQLEFMEVQLSFLGLQAKRSSFEERVTRMIEFRNFAVDVLPNVKALRELEWSQLEQLATLLENDERIKNYLQCDIGKIQEDWDKEKLLEFFKEMVQRMDEKINVAFVKLGNVIQALSKV